ncbi:hypothetical protein [Burkholderia sp. Ac-20365]|uniref:hypothetical protein n=1 Tax=Burkholderia sp. Ac-20365 TaxID=2703897 RepID=UPI00197CA53A|nr:hypothetical protein [Burkholderia sp. Ac-20365]MBN3761200.1 hypothetical protein [Burkholderia sp. Ac-20365]
MDKQELTNVIPLHGGDPNSSALRLANRYAVTTEQLQAAIRPLFLLMHDRGIGNIVIARDGKKALLTIDGETL